MSPRVQQLVAGLAAVVLIVLFWLFLWRPQSERIDEIEVQIADLETEEQTLRGRIAALEEVRARAPEIEAALAAAESVIPRDAAMPSMVRQLQLAARDSGVELIAINPTRPAAFSEAVPELSVISLTVELRGSYFQMVDFLRRVEDPAISSRGIEWKSTTVTLEEYPTLSGVLAGEMYATLPAPPEVPLEDVPEGEASPAPADDTATEEPTEDES